MRIMYDALNPDNIPGTAPMVASYIDGDNAPRPGWQLRFKGRVVVEIARVATNDAGDVADVENTDMTPEDVVGWVKLRRASGCAHAAVYCNASTKPEVVAEFERQGEAVAPFWVAEWDGDGNIPEGCIGKQYERGELYDTSVMSDTWPAAGGLPEPAPAPGTPGTYTVVEGDTLSGIAAAHDVTLAQLEAANPQAGHPPGDFSVIWPGDVVHIPAGGGSQPSPTPTPGPVRTYTVVEGDSMSAIASRYGVTLELLERANPQAGHPEGNFSDIWPGDVLRIP